MSNSKCYFEDEDNIYIYVCLLLNNAI